MPKTTTSLMVGSYEYKRSYFDWGTGVTTQDPPKTYTSSALGSFERSNLVRNAKQFDGYRLPSPYSGTSDIATHKVDIVIPPYSEREGWGTATHSYFGDMVCAYRPWVSYEVADCISDLKDPLRTKLLVNLKDEVLDTAMVIAEMQGTVDLIDKGLLRLARSMDAIKARKPEAFSYLMHGRRRDGRRPTDKFLRETASTYLEWKYGVMPTIMDISAACEALDINEEGSLFGTPGLMVARASIIEKSVEDGLLLSQHFNNLNCQIEVKKSAAARVDYSINAEGIRGLSRYGIGLGTVATIAYERTPFSFVLNMAFPLAELIKAWTSLSSGVDIRGYCETFCVLYTVLPGSGPIHSGRGTASWKASSDRVLSFKRFGGSTVSMPMPFIRNPLKVSNLATVLALFTQLRKPDSTGAH